MLVANNGIINRIIVKCSGFVCEGDAERALESFIFYFF